MKTNLDKTNTAYFFVYVLLFTLLVLVISAIYFVAAEKPFMKPIGLRKNKSHQ